jgi:hypothetical protein
MYIDLVRAYLLRYGTQSKLARVLGVTEAYLSFLLEPFRPYGQGRRDAYWAVVLDTPPHEIIETLKFLKAPSPDRATQLAEHLCSEVEEQALLLYHVACSRSRYPPHAQASTCLQSDEVVEEITAIGKLHAVALHGVEPTATNTAYLQVWNAALRALDGVDATRHPVEHAQVLMFLHDAASVLNRQDLALGYARQATIVLAQNSTSTASRDYVVRFRINALAAEVVSLNNLGLRTDAMRLALRARQAPGYTLEPESWMRTFFEQQLSSMATLPRFSIIKQRRPHTKHLNSFQAMTHSRQAYWPCLRTST